MWYRCDVNYVNVICCDVIGSDVTWCRGDIGGMIWLWFVWHGHDMAWCKIAKRRDVMLVSYVCDVRNMDRIWSDVIWRWYDVISVWYWCYMPVPCVIWTWHGVMSCENAVPWYWYGVVYMIWTWYCVISMWCDIKVMWLYFRVMWVRYGCDVRDMDVIWWHLNVMLWEHDLPWYQCDIGDMTVIWCDVMKVMWRGVGVIWCDIVWCA